MTNPPSPVNRRNLTRASIVGVILAVLAIVLFIVLWFVLGSFKLDTMPRLFVSLCIPPTVLAALIGAYILIKRPKA
jgi:lipopolysaccharide export LptBFGC system permease protein LptF